MIYFLQIWPNCAQLTSKLSHYPTQKKCLHSKKNSTDFPLCRRKSPTSSAGPGGGCCDSSFSQLPEKKIYNWRYVQRTRTTSTLWVENGVMQSF